MKKMSRKIIALAMAMTLSFAMVMTAMASDSVTGSASIVGSDSITGSVGTSTTVTGGDNATGNVTTPTTATGSNSVTGNVSTPTPITGSAIINGVSVQVDISEVLDSVKAELASTEDIKTLLGSDYVAGSTLELLGLVEANIPGQDLSAGVAITFDVPAVKAGDTIKVLHKRSSDHVWEVLDSTVTDGTVTATFTSLSPVAFVRVTGGNVADATVTAPKTGESNFIYIVEVLAALCLGGVFIVGRRKLAVK